ncbi:MAG TPA: hypothetical protein VJW76_13025, partial [Verrucomicrobiae bacterium]|nr:hypothetical protein [Verrucomicrobiae bacterium]
MQKPTTKDYAEYFRLALEAGLIREAEIEQWADKMIVEISSATPDWLLNLSIDREASKGRLLEVVPGETDKTNSWNLLLAHLGIAARTNRFKREQVVSMLYRWAIAGVIPEEHLSAAYALDAGLDGIKAGWFSERQFEERFEAFFRQFRSFET